MIQQIKKKSVTFGKIYFFEFCVFLEHTGVMLILTLFYYLLNKWELPVIAIANYINVPYDLKCYTILF